MKNSVSRFWFIVSSLKNGARSAPNINQKLETRNEKLGFTLVEMITVIAITGLVAAAVAVFLRHPMQAYADTARRAELSDIADTALRRIARDLRLAVPNSVRINGTALEFLMTRSGGRYRAEVAGLGPAGDPLSFTSAADTSFDVLDPIGVSAAVGDFIVIHNLGIPGADAYEGTTRRTYTGAAGTITNISFNPAGSAFPFASPNSRFQVVETPVSYICSGSTLTRYWGYAITAAQTNPPLGGNSSLLAQNISSCQFTYTPAVTQATGLVVLALQLSQGGETVTLLHQVHVDNVP